MVGADGQPLQLVKAYVDGIFAADSVKLVVRDGAERTVAETDYGREIALLCWTAHSCVVFRYDGLMPVLPENAWRLEEGQLVASTSPWLLALGAVAPLWTNSAGYAFSIACLAVPVVLFWLLNQAPASWHRSLLMTIGGLALLPYAGVWLYTVVILSYLSLPLVVVTGSASAGAVLLVRRALPASWTGTPVVLKVARMAAFIVAGLAAVAVTGILVLFVRLTSYSRSISFEEPPVAPPLASARVARAGGATHEIFATLANGVKLADAVHLEIFDGFDPSMTRDEAEKRLGPPSGVWDDPIYRVRAPYYERPGGRVSLVRRGADEWTTVGHPAPCTHGSVFRDPRLQEQVTAWLPPDGIAQVNIVRSAGWGGLSVGLSREGCAQLVLTAREDSPTVPQRTR